MGGVSDLELREREGAVLLRVAARPNAGRSAIQGVVGAALKVALGAPPEKGKANKELVGFLAKALGLKKSQLQLTAGATSRDKTVRIEGLDVEQLRSRIATALGS